MKNPKLMALAEHARRNASESVGRPRPARRVALAVRKAPDGSPTSQLATTAAEADARAATEATSTAVSTTTTPALPEPAVSATSPGPSGSSPPSKAAGNPPDQPTNRWLAIAVLVLLKATLLIGIIASRMIHLATGTEVVLNVTPVDPRSLFRGDYVIISTDAHRPPKSNVRSHTGIQDVFAALVRDDSLGAAPGTWRVASVTHERPAPVNEQVVMTGRGTLNGRPNITYGFESYFVPENTGRAIEKAIATKKVAIKLAIDSNGRAAIKELLIDGKPVHTTSMF